MRDTIELEQYGRIWATHASKIPRYKTLKDGPIIPKPVKTSDLLYDNLREFTNNTSLHGFRFFLNEKYTKFERYLWLVMVLCSILSCSFFIIKLTIQLKQNPVTLNFAEIVGSDWQIPFPAVTICSEMKVKQRVFNYSKAFEERWSVPPTINEKDLKIYNDTLLFCNNNGNDGPDFAAHDSIETIRKLTPSHEETFMACLWGNFSCKQMFYRTLTKDGYCFTFNMLSPEEMFKIQNLHNDYYYMPGRNKSTWTLENGYDPGTPLNTYPLRSMSYAGDEFEVILLTDVRDMDRLCSGPLQGFKIWLHNPAELPGIGQLYFRLPITYQSAAAIGIDVTTTKQNLRKYDPNTRRCYFSDERYLRFFRIYTENNCIFECAANYTAQLCGCVPPYMPRGPDTKICSGGKKNCVLDSIGRIFSIKSDIDSIHHKIGTRCNCLQSCTEIKYQAEVSQAVYDAKIFRRNSDPDIAQGWRQPSGLILYIADETFISVLRSEVYGTIHFLAVCGGFMGLFIGFSFLSLGEIVFYCTLRLWHYLRRPYYAFIN